MVKYAFYSLSLLILVSSSCFADDYQSYESKVGDKALNGFANMTTSVLEIPKSIINITNDSNIIWGILGGTIKAALNVAGRTITGATDLITAPLSTKPIVYPRYVWDNFDAN